MGSNIRHSQGRVSSDVHIQNCSATRDKSFQHLTISLMKGKCGFLLMLIIIDEHILYLNSPLAVFDAIVAVQNIFYLP